MLVEFAVGSRSCCVGIFSPGTPFFLPPQTENQHFQIPIRSGNSGRKNHLVDSTEI